MALERVFTSLTHPNNAFLLAKAIFVYLHIPPPFPLEGTLCAPSSLSSVQSGLLDWRRMQQCIPAHVALWGSWFQRIVHVKDTPAKLVAGSKARGMNASICFKIVRLFVRRLRRANFKIVIIIMRGGDLWNEEVAVVLQTRGADVQIPLLHLRQQ